MMRLSFSPRVIGCFVGLIGMVSSMSAAPEMEMTRLQPVAPEEKIPVTDFLRSPLLSTPELNDSGTHVAALVNSIDGTTRLMIVDRDTNKSSFVGGSDGTTVYAFTWLGAEHIAYNLASLQGIELGLMVANLNDLGAAYPVIQYTSAQIIGVPAANPMKPLVWLEAGGDDEQARLVELDVSKNLGGFIDVTGDAEALQAALAVVAERNEQQISQLIPRPETGYQLGYVANGAGLPAFAFTQFEGRAELWLWNGKSWDLTPIDPSEIKILEAGDQDGELVVLVPPAGGKPSAAHFFDAKTGKLGELVIQDTEYDFNGGFYRDPASRVIVGAFYDRNGPTTRWFDETYQKLQGVFNGYFPGKVVRLLDGGVRGAVFLVAMFSDKDPLGYYTLDLEKRTVAKLQSGQPWIDPTRMTGMQVLKYSTTDGHKLDAYVSLPEGASKTNQAPLVVLPHGGPWARSSWGFQGESQFFTSRGYAVIQPNYRGSVGYDWMFTDEDRVNFPMMSDDVTQAVKTLLKTGMIDAKRVAIVGGGFGGYLVLQGLVTEPELYRCGISHSGVYDWSWMANELGVDRNLHPTYGPLMQILGDPGTQAAKFAALSPAREVGRLKDPLLVVRERNAEGLVRSQSVRLVNGLKTVNADFKELLLDGSIAQLQVQVTLFHEIEAFLATQLKMPAPAPLSFVADPTAMPTAPAAEGEPEVEFKLNP